MLTRVLAVLMPLAMSSLAAPITTSSTYCTDGCQGYDLHASVIFDGPSLTATAYASNGLFSADASGTYDDYYVITLFGDQGTVGRFQPCLSISASDSGTFNAGSSAGASFSPAWGLSGSKTNQNVCLTTDSNYGYALAYNTPTLFHLHLAVSAYGDSDPIHGNGGQATASFYGIRSSPGTGYTLVEGTLESIQAIPEPSSIRLMASGLLVLPLTAAWKFLAGRPAAS